MCTRLLASLIVTLGLPGLAGADTCRWPDVSDHAGRHDDPGRGVSDWTVHQEHVLRGVGMENAHRLVAARLQTIQGCGDRADYARVYADVAILVAHYGRTHAGWKDGTDSKAPKLDQARGVAAWRAHRDHVLVGAGMEDGHALVHERLSALSKALPKATYARLYADLSILLANLARSAG
jgi:hypothetical protein